MSPERTNKRDRFYSRAHLGWGDLPYMDIDGMECCGDMPVLLVETKHSRIKEISLSGKTDHEIRKLRNLGQMSNLPVFVVVYWFFHHEKLLDADDFDKLNITHKQFYIIPINQQAHQWLTQPTQMTEQQWVELLHQFRGIKCVMQHNKTWRPVKLPKIIE